MAKRKKTSTTPRKAKRSPARPRRGGQLALPLGSPQTWPRVDRDLTGRGIVRGKPETFPPGMAMDASGWPVFNLVMQKPHPRAARAIQQDLKIKAEARARREAYTARLNRRPKEMQGADYTLPDDVRAFLRKRYPATVEYGAEWKIMNAVGWPDDYRLQIAVHEVIADAVHAAYMAGCTEGYIEGFVVRRIPDKERSKTGNDAKRSVLVTLPDGRTMTRDERDSIMAERFSQLAKLMKPTPAMQRLAGDFGFESWQGVRAVLKKVEASDRQ